MTGLETHSGIWEMVANTGPMVKLILALLFFLSVFSWAIILYKLNLLRKIEKETSSLYDLFWKGRDLKEMSRALKDYSFTPLSRIFKEVYEEGAAFMENPQTAQSSLPGGVDYLRRIAKKTAAAERSAMEMSINFLATTGNTAPFIGLFGTVWGIMNTFRSIGARGGANLAVVGPGISEALIATAMGLFAAIPAVIGYNYILSRIDRISTEMDGFSTDLVNLIAKQSGAPVHLTKETEV
ncbi:MAG: MotA/TolQ/ExbB proton channel family protein [Deltaproteobacteria bacterium]|nr:MotA/TolQ/ExbB proton channel family protein [Deltaproteobacteria bacterium]